MSNAKKHTESTNGIPQFCCDKGSIAFIVPFLFKNFGDGEFCDNVCTRMFRTIADRSKSSKRAASIYEQEKRNFVSQLKPSFPSAEVRYSGTSCEVAENKDYKGRNLCKCFSVCRKFHDDKSMNTPHIEVFLGSYPITYSLPDGRFFKFKCDALLLLSDELGSECGYLIFNIDKKTITPDIFATLDVFIFIKHLFYKSRLKCDIVDKKHVSIQEWADQYIRKLMKRLEIDPSKAVNKHVLKQSNSADQGAAFSYSILQLENIHDSGQISIANIEEFKQVYANQLYGLLVSDEGWRYGSKEDIFAKFKNNYWSSKTNTCSFFLGRNVLTINQTDEALNKDLNGWFENYVDLDPVNESNHVNFYKKYVNLHSCFPGVKSLTLFFYLKAIYKDMMLGKTKEYIMETTDSPDEKYQRLTVALQSYSMSLETMRNVEDMICIQFNMPAEIESLRNRCEVEAANRQNSKMRLLTIVTAGISLIAIIVSMLSISSNENLLLKTESPTTIIMYVLLGIASAIFIWGACKGEKIQLTIKNAWDKCVHFNPFQ